MYSFHKLHSLIKRNKLRSTVAAILFTLSQSALADEAAEVSISLSVDAIFLALAASLVFVMQIGFTLLEAGACRTKNAINIIMKNYMDVSIGLLTFWCIGFGLMFGLNQTGYIGTNGFFFNSSEDMAMGFLSFQAMFAATAATITSGALAERTKYIPYLVGTVAITGLVYPVYGSWVWGGYLGGEGWLAALGFVDFAGSTVVHSVGAWCALAAIIVIGPRIGRFDKRGNAHEIPGHNASFVAVGGLLLWFGWFGFNAGSLLKADTAVGPVMLNTVLAGSAGVFGTLFWVTLLRKPVLVMHVVNGSLAGLVAITAGAPTMDPAFAILTGFIAGIVMLLATELLITLKLDDVVGAIPVHGFAGLWGTLATGMFYKGNLFNSGLISVQLIGAAVAFLWAFPVSFIVFYTMKKTIGLRVKPIEEQRGLDFSEHNEIGYPEFSTQSAYDRGTFDSINQN